MSRDYYNPPSHHEASEFQPAPEQQSYSWPRSMPSQRCPRACCGHDEYREEDTSDSSSEFWASGLHFTRKGDVFTSGKYKVRKKPVGHYDRYIWHAEGDRFSRYGNSPREAAELCIVSHRGGQ